ncbi:MAG: hypothetical protein V1781_08805 [Bacteroidota bacterium]
MKKKSILLLLFSLSILQVSAVVSGIADKKSNTDDNAKGLTASSTALIDEGNKLLSKGQFSAAMSVWQKVLEQDASNANANFKMGMCYFNSLDEQSKALPYLKKASLNFSSKYNFFDASEKTAPYDVLYFLAQTFLTLNQPDSALLFFFQYDDKFGGNPPIPIDKQIRNCINAKNSVKSPRDVIMKNPGKNVNSQFAETNPVLTLDNSVMFFSSRRPTQSGATNEVIKTLSDVTGRFDEDIYITRKDASGKWEAAVPFKWNTDKDEAPLFISADGLTLYFRKIRNGQSDIYMSNYVDKVWSNPKAVSEINSSSSNETGISISADGKYLYFCSDREGGKGKFDIYQCTKSRNKWSSPKNIGTDINTSFSEISPYINPNGKTLFFSSNGYNNVIGGLDIFYSEMKDDGSWTHPQNMGFPINTVRDDINYYVISGGTRYYATIREDADSYDIFKIEGGGLSIENIDASGQIVTLTKEMSVTDVMEVEKTVEKEVEVVETIETTVEVIKEIEKVDVEKEKAKMDSMMMIARTEAKNEKLQLEAAIVKAKADSISAVASIKTAEAEKAKAEAEIKKADAEKIKAEVEKSKADAEKSKAEAVIAKAEADKEKAKAVIAAAQKVKDELAKTKMELDIQKTNAARAQAEANKAKAEADKIKSEENKVKLEADKIIAEQKNLELKNQLAETEKPKYEAMKVKAEADKLKSEEAIANVQKAKDNLAKTKIESDIQKANAAVEKAKADADIKKADAEKLKAQADIANAEKAKDDAKKAEALAEKSKADAEAKKAQAEILKSQIPKSKPINPAPKTGG